MCPASTATAFQFSQPQPQQQPSVRPLQDLLRVQQLPLQQYVPSFDAALGGVRPQRTSSCILSPLQPQHQEQRREPWPQTAQPPLYVQLWHDEHIYNSKRHKFPPTASPRDGQPAVPPLLARCKAGVGKAVPHVQQEFSWDCGLACVLMVLHQAAPNTCSLDLATLRSYCPTTSIWTIDLAHLLRRFGVMVAMTTTMLGPNPEYSSEAFYVENLPDDEHRVAKLFKEAPLCGIPVHQRSVTGAEVQLAVGSGRYLAIALVDKVLLGLGPLPLRPPASPAGEVAYIGHYIVVTDYCAATDSYAIQDPAACSAAPLAISAAVFDRARCAFGTDEDLLLVATPAAGGGIPPPGVDLSAALSAISRC